MPKFLRSLRPGDDRKLAAQLRAERAAAERKAEAERARAIRAMSDRDKRRSAAEVAASKERGRRSKRGPHAPPAPWVNP